VGVGGKEEGAIGYSAVEIRATGRDKKGEI